MRRIKNNNRFVIKCSGRNLSKFIFLCTENDIVLREISRENGQVLIELNEHDMKVLKTIDTSNFEYEIVSVGGMKRVANLLLYRIGFVLGLIISIIAMFFINNRLLHVHVYGLSSISKDEVVDSVRDYGVGILSSLDFDTKPLEKHLSKKFKFSLVSIITKGNTLIINVKEELPDISDTYVPITSDYNMIIDKIVVYSGTSNVKVGDIVYKGDVLVEPCLKDENDIVYVTPCAEIVGRVFFSSGYNFLNKEEKKYRSGKKEIISSKITLGKMQLLKSQKDNDFLSYELESCSSCIANYFLPIKIEKTYAYEIVSKTIERDFENEKEELVLQVKNNAYKQLPTNLTCSNEQVIITPCSNGYMINVYLECDVNLKYNLK